MDDRRFDVLARSLAGPRSRRGLLAGFGAVAAAAFGHRNAAAQDGCPIPGQIRNRKGECRCPPGTDACPDGCFDRKSDPANCGACGNVCPDGAVCRKGACRCPSGTIECLDGSCAPADDPLDCGCAHERCPLNEHCGDGLCQCGDWGETAAPSTCCTDGSTQCIDGDGTHPNSVVAEACDDPADFHSRVGHSECRGQAGTPDWGGDSCQVCCPPGTTCDPLGFCRQ
jgi:hypothetical protein